MELNAVPICNNSTIESKQNNKNQHKENNFQNVSRVGITTNF